MVKKYHKNVEILHKEEKSHSNTDTNVEAYQPEKHSSVVKEIDPNTEQIIPDIKDENLHRSLF